MSGQQLPVDITANHLDQPPGFTGGADTYGVTQRDFVAAAIEQLTGDGRDLLGRYCAINGAAQHAGNVTAHPHAVLLG